MINIPVLAREAFRKDETEKKYRIELADGSDVIENDRLVEESVTLTERICSGSELKFGLCEASCIEFQCYNTPNIKGKEITAYLYIESEEVPIPLGTFTVDTCPIEQVSGIRKVTAYNKLRSEYLDADLTEVLSEVTEPGSEQISIFGLKNKLLQTYEIKQYQTQEQETTPTYNLRSVIVDSADVELGTLPLPNGYNNSSLEHPYLYLVFAGKGILVDGLSSTEHYNIEMPIELKTERDRVVAELMESTAASFQASGANANVQDTLGKYAANVVIRFVDGAFKTYTIEEINAAKPLTNISEINVYLLLYAAIRTTIEGGAAEDTIAEWGNIEDTGNAETSVYSKEVDFEKIGIHKLVLEDVEKLRISKNMTGITLRKVLSANYELLAQFGKLDRESDLIRGTELNAGGLYPQETLYPSELLYPVGADASIQVMMYEKLWTEPDRQQKFRKLIVNYKGEATDETGKTVEKQMQYTVDVNADGNTDYIVTGNWILENIVMTEDAIARIAVSLAEKMKNIIFSPFEMQLIGLPYLEAGDAIEIKTGTETVKSYVLQRTMTGIKALTDVFVNGEVDFY